jgi:hypothetical protein
MTNEEKNRIRADATIALLAATFGQSRVDTKTLREATPEEREKIGRNHARDAAIRAEWAATEASAVVAELMLREDGPEETQLAGLGGATIDPRALAPRCVHSIPFTEECPLCDASGPLGGDPPAS